MSLCNVKSVIALLVPAILVAMPLAASEKTPDPVLPKGVDARAFGTFRSTGLNDTDFKDLAAFGAAIGTARYVVLGEQTHGEGNVFTFKTRLVRYLHEELGFDVLALESGLYDGAKINSLRETGKALKDVAPGNLFFMYATTKEMAPLLDYLDTQAKGNKPLMLATFDSQQSGQMSIDSMLVDLADYLNRHHSDLPRSPGWSDFVVRSRAILQMSRTAPDAATQQNFFALLDRIDHTLQADAGQSAQFPNGVSFWLRVTASLRSQAEAFWLPQAVPGYNAARERAMAGNVLWLLNKQYPNKKVIFWAHDFHGQKAPLHANMTSMAAMVRDRMPKEHFYHVYFTGYQGNFFDFVSEKVLSIATPHKNSIETTLHAAQQKHVFIDLKKAPGLANFGVGSYDTFLRNSDYFSDGKPTLREFTDGIFYFDTITPATRLPNN